VIERLVAQGWTSSRVDGSKHELFPIAIPARLGEALRSRVVREDAVRTVEVGLGFGLSALHICDGLIANGHRDARHVVVDPYQRTGPDGVGFASCGLQALEDAGVLSMVEYHEGESQTVLAWLLHEKRQFDVAFIDGNHRFERVFVDLYYLGRMVTPGGVIMLDDYDLPGVARAAAFFVANLGWELEEVSEPGLHQWAVLRTSGSPDIRHFADFVEF
jgi:predicted O-methyltransferase YrrM